MTPQVLDVSWGEVWPFDVLAEGTKTVIHLTYFGATVTVHYLEAGCPPEVHDRGDRVRVVRGLPSPAAVARYSYCEVCYHRAEDGHAAGCPGVSS